MPEQNLYQRGDTWWLRAEIGGRKYRESLRTDNVREARRFRDARIKEIEGAVFRGDRKRPWKEAVVAWHEHESGQLAQTTMRRYLVSLAQMEPHLVTLDIAKIDGKALQDAVQARRRAGATPATIRRDLTAVSRVIEFANAHAWREGNPTLDVRRLLRERRDPIHLPTEESYRMMVEGSSPEFARLIVAARLTGCRQDELVNVTWRQFDPCDGEGTLDVIGKGAKRRTIRLSQAATKFICSLPVVSDLIFPRENGEAFAQASSDFTHFRRKVEAAGQPFDRFRFHDLRHWYAVEYLRAHPTEIYTLSKHLGHTSVQTTEIYLSFIPARAA